MEAITVAVSAREEFGSAQVRKARKLGRIPAVMYSHGTENKLVYVEEQEYVRRIQGVGMSQLFQLTSSDSELNGRLVLIKDIQIEPIKSKVLHLDLLALKADERVKVSIALEIKGESAAIKSGDYMLNQSAFEVEIECLPTDIPKAIYVDISSLGGAQSIHASDLILPPGAKLVTDGKVSIVSAVHKKEEAVAAVAAPAAGAEGAAQAAAAPEAAEKGDKEKK